MLSKILNLRNQVYFCVSLYRDILFSSISFYYSTIKRMTISDTYLGHSEVSRMVVFCKNIKCLSAVKYFRKKASSWMFDWVFWIRFCSYVLENSDQCEKNTKKRPKRDWKIFKHKDHVPHKKQKATKIVESYICSEWLEASLKANRDEKCRTLYRKDNSSVKRHKGSWHMGYFENSKVKLRNNFSTKSYSF